MKQQVPLFIQSRPNRTTLNRLASDFEYLNVTKDCLLIKEGEPAKKVFIVIEGDFIITKKIYSKNVQTEDVNKIKEDPIKAQRVQSKFNRKNNQRKIDKHVLGYVTPGYLIGEDDVRLGYDIYSTTVKCISQRAKLLQISKENFVSRLQNQSATWNLLSSQVSKKLKDQMAHMKKTNQARERVSPHIKKGEEGSDAPKDMKMTSIEAKLKDVKSTGNFSTASNEDYTDAVTTVARSQAGAFKAFTKLAKPDGYKATLEQIYNQAGDPN